MTDYKQQMYFAKKPTTKHDKHVVDYQFAGLNLKFNTDAGVFSKFRIDYGSGVLIKAMKEVAFPSQGILDVGTGYGPLGLFASKFWPAQEVTMVDVNERAVDLAKSNAELNNCHNVKIYLSNIYEKVPVTKKFGLIITNPPIRAGKKVVKQFLSGAKSYLVSNGVLLVVIQKKQGEPSARKLLQTTFQNCEILARDKGYYILKAQER